jgi:hypothetical protein
MNKYIKPAIEIELFEIEDVITTSSGESDDLSYRLLKTAVNGKEGMNYGNQEVSIFDIK